MEVPIYNFLPLPGSDHFGVYSFTQVKFRDSDKRKTNLQLSLIKNYIKETMPEQTFDRFLIQGNPDHNPVYLHY